MTPAQFRPLWEQAVAVWKSGGWGMAPLAFDGVVMYAMGMAMLLKLFGKGAFRSADRAWRRWKNNRLRGPVGLLITEAMECRGIEEAEYYFAAVRSDELAPFERDMKVMKVSITAAPLLGLLGTVTGMLTTFKALASGGGGERTMALIAGGISEALITTETGLILALTGLMLQFTISRQRDRYGKLVTHLETLCLQEFQRRRAAA